MDFTLNDVVSALLHLPADQQERAIVGLNEAVVASDRRLWQSIHENRIPVPEGLEYVLQNHRGCFDLLEMLRHLDYEGYPDRGKDMSEASLVLMGRLTFPGDELARLDVATGAYERMHSLRPGEVVVDGGAHVGWFTERAALSVGSQGIVLAVEPEPRNYFKLTERVGGLGNVLLCIVALYDRTGVRPLSIDPRASSTHSIEYGQGPYLPVGHATLDGLWPSNIDRLDLLKLDVEGAESAALNGAIATVTRFRPSIVVEVNRQTSEDCFDFMERFNYVVHGANMLTEEPRRGYCPLGTGILWGEPR